MAPVGEEKTQTVVVILSGLPEVEAENKTKHKGEDSCKPFLIQKSRLFQQHNIKYSKFVLLFK